MLLEVDIERENMKWDDMYSYELIKKEIYDNVYRNI